jgi:hypothetical protein
MARWFVERRAGPQLAEVDWSRFPASVDPQETGRGLLRRSGTRDRTDVQDRRVGTAARTHGFFAAPLLDMADVAAAPRMRPVGAAGSPDGVSITAGAVHRPCVRATPRARTVGAEVLAEAGLSVPQIQALFCHHVL